MYPRSESALETRLAEVLMSALFPCDLGDGIEVLHDVEMIEIEMDCDLAEDAWESAPYEKIEIQFEPTAVAPPFEDLSARERIAGLHLRSLSAFERSAVWDTLPFAPFEPADVRDVRDVRDESAFALGTSTETVPYPLSDVDTVPFSRPRPTRRR